VWATFLAIFAQAHPVTLFLTLPRAWGADSLTTIIADTRFLKKIEPGGLISCCT
jgi:hypothetical protein